MQLLVLVNGDTAAVITDGDALAAQVAQGCREIHLTDGEGVS